jgi:hypothetical protein
MLCGLVRDAPEAIARTTIRRIGRSPPRWLPALLTRVLKRAVQVKLVLHLTPRAASMQREKRPPDWGGNRGARRRRTCRLETVLRSHRGPRRRGPDTPQRKRGYNRSDGPRGSEDLDASAEVELILLRHCGRALANSGKF